jgi:hypothetical protein
MPLEADLRARVVSLLRRSSALSAAPLVWRALALYCCRLLTRAEFRSWLHASFGQSQDLREGLFALKESLDCSELPNRVLRAIHDLSRLERRHSSHYRTAAEAHNLGLTDLRLLERSLSSKERAQIRQRWHRGVGPALTRQRLTQLVTRFDPICRGLIKHYLTFAWQNDRATSFLDLCDELRVETLRLCRHYEIYLYSEERFLRCVHRGLENRVKNLAKQFGRQSRRCVERTHTAATTCTAWYLSPTTQRLHKVKICGQPKARRRQGGELQTVAAFRSGRIHWLNLQALYSSKEAAKLARFETRRGKPRPSPLICLSADLNDFRATACSLDTPLGSGGSMTLHDVLTSTPPAESPSVFLQDLSRAGASEHLQAFARVVIGECQDQLFTKWVSTHNQLEVGTLSPQQLGRLAAAWVGTDLAQIKSDLLSTSTALWSRQQLALLRSAEKHDGAKAPND